MNMKLNYNDVTFSSNLYKNITGIILISMATIEKSENNNC